MSVYLSRAYLASEEQLNSIEIKELGKSEAEELILKNPYILPHLKKKRVIAYPEFLNFASNSFKARSIVLVNTVKPSKLSLILFEYYDVAEPLSMGGYTLREIMSSSIYKEFVGRAYRKIIAYIERIDLCRSKAEWVIKLRNWINDNVKKIDRETLCKESYVNEVTLVFRDLNIGTESLVRYLDDELDIRVFGSEIKKMTVDSKTIYIVRSYIPPYKHRMSEEEREMWLKAMYNPYAE
ncbi:MAG: hypothetical protein ABWJ42_02000 [Sulfolobales archaeon]